MTRVLRKGRGPLRHSQRAPLNSRWKLPRQLRSDVDRADLSFHRLNPLWLHDGEARSFLANVEIVFVVMSDT